MKRSLPVLMAALTAVVLSSAGCGDTVEQTAWTTNPQIVVTGTGYAQAEPDLAVIVAGVDITAKDPAEAVEEAARTAERIIEAARGMGLEDADMQTASYNLWVEDEYDPYTYAYTGEKNYRVQHSIRFETRQLDGVGDLLAAVVRAGANSVSSVSFTVEDQATLSDAAYKSAATDAAARAGSLAEAMGVELGEITYISQYGSPYPVGDISTVYRGAFACAGESTVSVPVTAGTIMVTAQIQVTYSLGGRT